MQAARTPLLCPLIVTALLVAAMLLPTAQQDQLEYLRSGLAEGEVWRLISGHLVHLGWSHLLMNLLGFWLIQQLFIGRELSTPACLGGLLLLSLCVSAGLWWFNPEIAWYRGLSGVLHGLIIWALLRDFQRQPVSNGLLLVLVILKLAWEQFSGPVPGSESIAKGRVIVAAHLYGGLAGVLLWLLEIGIRKLSRGGFT